MSPWPPGPGGSSPRTPQSRSPATRREFLAESAELLVGGWSWLHLPLLAGLASCSREAAERGEPFSTLSPGEGATLRAVAARILPSGDGLPGAEEAGAVYFMAQFLGKHVPAFLEPVRSGVRDLDRRSGDEGFASLPPDRQDALLHGIEDTPFFALVRTLTLAGVLADPRYGGNRGNAGARLVGIEPHAGANTPPFGWYDAEYAKAGGRQGGGG